MLMLQDFVVQKKEDLFLCGNADWNMPERSADFMVKVKAEERKITFIYWRS
jgi:hypothetical protein